VRLLLDTRAALWWLTDEQRLTAAAAAHIDDPTVDLFVSAVVVWEMSIKRSIGKLDTPGEIGPALASGGARPLPVTFEHAAAVEHLPWHHRDPFDRLLVAQAAIEGAAIVSGDPAFRAYDVPVVW